MVDALGDEIEDYESRQPKPSNIIQLFPHNKLLHGRLMNVTPAEIGETVNWPAESICTSTGTVMASTALFCTYNTEALCSWS